MPVSRWLFPLSPPSTVDHICFQVADSLMNYEFENKFDTYVHTTELKLYLAPPATEGSRLYKEEEGGKRKG